MNTLEFPASAKTLRQRLNEGRIPVQDGLRYAAFLADALRRLHDEGRAHSSVTPDAIVLTATGLSLLPAVLGVFRVTPYTAPEAAAARKPAGARGDIFSFGAVVFEILTGRCAFEGETESALVATLRGTPAPPSGSPALDRLLAGCLAKDPEQRLRLIQKVQLDLKLLTAAARRASAPPVSARGGGVSDAAILVELARFEARVTAKLHAHEQAAADAHRYSSEAVDALRGQLSVLSAQLAAAQEKIGRGADSGPSIEPAGERTPSESTSRFEIALESLREQIGEFHTRVAADMREIELNLKAQSNAIDSAHTAMAQTGDLVGRIVEALESQQFTVLKQTEDRSMALK